MYDYVQGTMYNYNAQLIFIINYTLGPVPPDSPSFPF